MRRTNPRYACNPTSRQGRSGSAQLDPHGYYQVLLGYYKCSIYSLCMLQCTQSDSVTDTKVKVSQSKDKPSIIYIVQLKSLHWECFICLNYAPINANPHPPPHGIGWGFVNRGVTKTLPQGTPLCTNACP